MTTKTSSGAELRSAPKFTPWRIDYARCAGHIVRSADGTELIVDYMDDNCEHGAIESEEHARLIAAAPELYQAVAMLVEWWDREEAGPQYSDPAGRDGPRGDAEQQDWFYGNVNLAGETHKLARAALAKARGEA